MKILALSLLRLGDFIMHQKVRTALLEKHPGAEIVFAVNDVIAEAAQTLTKDRLLIFPRSTLQEKILHKDRSFFSAMADLDAWLSRRQVEDFDLCIDLTHTQFSRKIALALDIPFVQASRDSYLNQFFSFGSRSTFHYVDALQVALNLPATKKSAPAPSTEKNLVLFQVSTSDKKKNWPLTSFAQVITALKVQLPGKAFKIICSPTEEQSLIDAKIIARQDILACDFHDAQEYLKLAGWLVSLDTATLHLAAQLDVPTVGLYLGSAEPTKTAPYRAGNWIVQSAEPCSPCRHSVGCPYPTHRCGDSISVPHLTKTIFSILNGDERALSSFAYQSHFQIYQTYQDENGFIGLRSPIWDSSQVAGEFSRQVFLSEQIGHPPEPKFSSPDWLVAAFCQEKKEQLSRTDSWLKSLSGEIEELEHSHLATPMDHLSWQKLFHEFIHYDQHSEWSAWLNEMSIELKKATPEHRLLLFKQTHATLLRHHQGEVSFLKTIQSHLFSKGALYVSGPPKSA